MITYIDTRKSDVNVEWSWYDKPEGTIKWTFANNTDTQKSVVLLRNSYYFGNAFWPIYDANDEFHTKFVQKVEPLADDSTQTNSPPLFIGEVNGKYIALFLFTLNPDQEWSMLEGGYVNGIEPTGIALYDVTDMQLEEMCVGYDNTQVTSWDSQTGTTLKGYDPNPSTMDVIVGKINGPYIQLFDDPISAGKCNSEKPHPNCDNELNRSVAAFQSGNIMDGIKDIMDYIGCEFNIGIDDKDRISDKILHKLRY